MDSLKIREFVAAKTFCTPDFSNDYLCTCPAKTDDLHLINNNGQMNLVNQFLKIGPALKTLDALQKISRMKVVNYVEEILKTPRRERRK